MDTKLALPEEEFALRRIFANHPTMNAFIQRLLPTAEVVRERSSVGFFATFTFLEPLPDTSENQWDWNFKHRKMQGGGSFVCWREGPDALGLEGVSLVNSWPASFEPADFTET
jgi:hypothetical protein